MFGGSEVLHRGGYGLLPKLKHLETKGSPNEGVTFPLLGTCTKHLLKAQNAGQIPIFAGQPSTILGFAQAVSGRSGTPALKAVFNNGWQSEPGEWRKLTLPLLLGGPGDLNIDHNLEIAGTLALPHSDEDSLLGRSGGHLGSSG